MASAVGSIVKNTVVYGYAFSQPFAFYIDAYPMIQNEALLEEQTIQFGQSGELVEYLQVKLNNLGYYDDNLDGEYGILTEHAVKKMQSTHQLDPNGIADDETLQTLITAEKAMKLKEIDLLIEDVHFGSTSDQVKQIQEILYLYGYYQAEIDSIYGPITDKAYHSLKIEIEGPPAEILVQQSTNTQDAANDADNMEVKEATSPQEVVSETSHSNDLISIAKSYIGIQYVWGGTSEAGFDCSGFIQYVYEQHNITIPRTVSDIWNFSTPTNSPSVGDLVFFETYKTGPSHLGIYLGDGDFIHAGASNGVEISNLENSYWQPRYLGSKRIN